MESSPSTPSSSLSNVFQVTKARKRRLSKKASDSEKEKKENLDNENAREVLFSEASPGGWREGTVAAVDHCVRKRGRERLRAREERRSLEDLERKGSAKEGRRRREGREDVGRSEEPGLGLGAGSVASGEKQKQGAGRAQRLRSQPGDVADDEVRQLRRRDVVIQVVDGATPRGAEGTCEAPGPDHQRSATARPRRPPISELGSSITNQFFQISKSMASCPSTTSSSSSSSSPSNVFQVTKSRRPRLTKKASDSEEEKKNLDNGKRKRSSSFRGVTRHRRTGRFEARLWDKNPLQNKKGKTRLLQGQL
ncbi:hypothetical protein ZIOFF_025720 [Zingiber officinale]|uniref:Uncharacterized protein n=1 Tax=Zingiber officinale TaxID=94328 RepID=A0A8J5LJZ5_ZINOF|nr:hypothetical protein ZIOFF_025720 [Zingiber officinale]